MNSLTVRIDVKSHQALRELAAQTGETLQAVLSRAIEEYQRKRFWEQANADYAALRNDPEAWQEELEERALWESALTDGLEDKD
jgi:hypothetical protein